MPAKPPTDGFVFPVPSNQKANQFLKDIAKAAGISKPITMHMARHTFATYSLNIGMPLEVVQRVLGHSSVRTTEIYARIVNKTVEEQMKKWDA